MKPHRANINISFRRSKIKSMLFAIDTTDNFNILPGYSYIGMLIRATGTEHLIKTIKKICATPFHKELSGHFFSIALRLEPGRCCTAHTKKFYCFFFTPQNDCVDLFKTKSTCIF
jgi:hypothetical protein